MSEWRPGQPLPGHVADAFADIYDWFEEPHYLDAYNNLWKQHVDGDAVTAAHARRVAAGGLATPPQLADDLTPGRHRLARRQDKGPALNAAYAAYRALHAIDRAIGPGHPLRTEFAERARFNTDATDGYVLPKVTQLAFRTKALADEFMNLVRADVQRDQVHVLGAARRGYADHPLLPQNPKIVVAPFLYRCFEDDHGPADARFVAWDRPNAHYFTVEHNAAQMPALEQRVRDAVAAIRITDATIAIFPELALNPRLLDVLRQELNGSNSPGAPLQWVIAGAAAPLLPWVVAGTDADREAGRAWPGINMVQVFSGGGAAIAHPLADGTHLMWRQAKRHPYTLDREAQANYGIDACFAEPHDRDEAIALGRHICAFDHGWLRCAVVICEDLNQEARTIAALRKLLCNVVITLVMDGPVKDSGWAADRSRTVSSQTGGYCVTVNSLLMPNLERARAYELSKLPKKRGRPPPDPYPSGDKPVASWIEPQRPGAGRPAMRFVLSRASPVPGDPRSLISEVLELPLF